MTIAFVGSTGHVGYAFDPMLESAEFPRVALAPASADDNMTYMAEACRKKGKEVAEYATWQEILENEKIDILVNCSVCGYMAAINTAFLKAGAHVFSEKPLARTMEELDEMEAAWKESGKVLLSMLPFRYDKGFRAARAAILRGEIGEVRMVSARKSYKLGKRASYYCDQSVYGGTIPWVGAHAIDFLLFLSGEHIKEAAAWNSSLFNGGHGDLDVTAACAFGMTGGVVGTATLDYFRPAGAATHGDDRARAVGTEGVIEIAEHVATLTKNGNVVLDDVSVPDIFEDFMNQVKGIGTPVLTPEESFENARACLGTREAAESGSIYRFDI